MVNGQVFILEAHEEVNIRVNFIITLVLMRQFLT